MHDHIGFAIDKLTIEIFGENAFFRNFPKGLGEVDVAERFFKPVDDFESGIFFFKGFTDHVCLKAS
ncbi:hypothetical protein D3C72_1828560 [compost metagenome]